MTCIIGYVDKDGNIFMGADRLTTSGNNGNNKKIIRRHSKVFLRGDMLMGCTGFVRLAQLLRFKLKIPKHPKKMDDYEFMCTLFSDSVRDCLKKNGYCTIESNVEKIYDTSAEILIGYKSRFYKLYCDFQVSEMSLEDNYLVCGCGEKYALGSLATNKEKDVRKIIFYALKVAEKFSGGVQRPFDIIRIKSFTPKT